MKVSLKHIIIFTLLIGTKSISQSFNEKVEAKIEIHQMEDMIKITGTAYNKTEISQSLRYELSVIKNNPENANRSKNKQGGRFILESGQKKELSSTTINNNSKDRIIVLLLIYNLDDELIGKDRYVYNDVPNIKNELEVKNKLIEETSSKDISKNNDDGITLTGIVIENVKTKPARDFYKLFYSDYMLHNLKTSKVVRVDEELRMGNSTIIKLFVGDRLVYQFIVNPNSEYLKTKSNESIKIIGKYLAYLEKNKEVFQHY